MRDCWAAKPNEATYATYLFTVKRSAIVCSSARRAIRAVRAGNEWHSSFAYVAAHGLFGLRRAILQIGRDTAISLAPDNMYSGAVLPGVASC
jgi:hypothetical protein